MRQGLAICGGRPVVGAHGQMYVPSMEPPNLGRLSFIGSTAKERLSQTEQILDQCAEAHGCACCSVATQCVAEFAEKGTARMASQRLTTSPGCA